MTLRGSRGPSSDGDRPRECDVCDSLSLCPSHYSTSPPTLVPCLTGRLPRRGTRATFLDTLLLCFSHCTFSHWGPEGYEGRLAITAAVAASSSFVWETRGERWLMTLLLVPDWALCLGRIKNSLRHHNQSRGWAQQANFRIGRVESASTGAAGGGAQRSVSLLQPTSTREALDYEPAQRCATRPIEAGRLAHTAAAGRL